MVILVARGPLPESLDRPDFPPRVHTVFLVFQSGQVSFVLQSTHTHTHTHTHTQALSLSVSVSVTSSSGSHPQRSVCIVRSNHGMGVGNQNGGLWAEEDPHLR